MRVFKTRSLAAAACKGGKIELNGQSAKPSKDLQVGDVIRFKRGVVTYTYEVLDFPSGRVSGKDVARYYADNTPETELVKSIDMKLMPLVRREKGTGRPTKRDRRDLDNLMS